MHKEGTGLRKAVRPSTFEALLFVGVRTVLTIISFICLSIDVAAWHHHKICEATRVCKSDDRPESECEEFEETMYILMPQLVGAIILTLCTVVSITRTFGVETTKTSRWAARFDIDSLVALEVAIAREGANVAKSGIVIGVLLYRYVIMQAGDSADILYPDNSDRTGVKLMVTTVTVVMAASVLHVVLLVNYISIRSKQVPVTKTSSERVTRIGERVGLMKEENETVDIPLSDTSEL